jgi:hypothetical protein
VQAALNARVRSATKSPRLSQRAGAEHFCPSLGIDHCQPLVAPGGQRSGQSVQPIVLSSIAAREHSYARRELGRHVHHHLAGRCQPLGQVSAETSGVLDGPTTLAKPFRPTSSRALKPARFCGKLAHSMSSPTSSTAARAMDALWGSTPINTFVRTHLRSGRISLPLAFGGKDTPTLWAVLSHTSFESLRTPFFTGGTQA